MTYKYSGTETWTGPRQALAFDHTKCGTRKGYRQHQNHGTPTCQPCRDANTAYMNARNATHHGHPQEIAA